MSKNVCSKLASRYRERTISLNIEFTIGYTCAGVWRFGRFAKCEEKPGMSSPYLLLIFYFLKDLFSLFIAFFEGLFATGDTPVA